MTDQPDAATQASTSTTTTTRVLVLLTAKPGVKREQVMEALPLAKEHMLDHEYIRIGPLTPLRLLVGSHPAKQ